MNRKLLRTIGIAIIIILPDPTFISDVIGLLLVASSYLFSHQKKLSYEQLNGLVIYHLGYRNGGEPGNYEVNNHALRRNYQHSRTSPSSYSDELLQRMVATGPIVNHALNRHCLKGSQKIVGSFNPKTQSYCWYGQVKA
jgi:hypothetical protein